MKRSVAAIGMLLTFFTVSVLQGQETVKQDACVRPVFLSQPSPWADSMLTTLTLREKIGQLFMVAAWSDPKHQSYDAAGMDLLIERYGIGGIIFFQGSPVRQAKLTNRFQSHSKVPLLIGMDAEWGLGMRLDSTISYPRQMTLGAVQDESLIYEFGLEMARQLNRLGVHVSFSPVVDVNNNPLNPVISNRAFGENRELVARHSYQYMKGLQDGGVLANAKHFPGHGDTDTDSHKDLPVIPFTKERLDSVEFYPYNYLFNHGLSSVMIAHLFVPALDSTPNVPSTLSRKVVTDVLRGEMGFEGLIFTDAMNMQGVSKYFAPGEADLHALMAGNDVLLYPMNVGKAIDRIVAAVDSGLVTVEEIDQHCLRVLRAKEWAGLNTMKPVETKNLVSDLNTPYAHSLRRRIVESSITVVRNNCNLAPLCYSDSSRVAVVSIGDGTESEFARAMRSYAAFDHFVMEKNPDFRKSMLLHDTLVTYDIVIAAMVNTSNKASRNFGVSNEAARILNSVGERTNVALAVFANPYALNTLRSLNQVETVVVCYQDDALTQQVAAEVIAGACTADGKLPVSVNSGFRFGEGLTLQQQVRLRWVDPAYIGLCGGSAGATESYDHRGGDVPNAPKGKPYKEDMMSDRSGAGVSVKSECLTAIDSIAIEGITKGAYPGCRVLAAKDGLVFYDRSFGTLDWNSNQAVNSNTVYDLASITKVVSSTLAVMKLVDEGKMKVDGKLGDYLAIPEGNPYADVVIRDMLSHRAGFVAWIPFYQATMSHGKLRDDIYRRAPEPGFTHQVADSLYILDTYSDSIFNRILREPLDNPGTYRYSDLGYYFIQRIVEDKTGMGLDEFVNLTFYQPMGLESMGYNPLKRIEPGRIAPTEDDQLWRGQHVRGYVHDQGAGMMGGVAGHAGVFSTARDLAAVMQMLLNGGSYAGIQFLTRETIDVFNTRHFSGNRRGLGFDKPSLTPGSGSTCREASASSFGHTGFTGTMCWADPETGIVYVFLSNRVSPDAENKKIQQMDIRTRIQAEIYRAVESASGN